MLKLDIWFKTIYARNYIATAYKEVLLIEYSIRIDAVK